MSTVEQTLQGYAELIERNLEVFMPQECLPQARIAEACRYSLLGGGKRLRPALLLEFYRLCGGEDPRVAMPFACGLEMIHTYSLIHDDLPCMDDDDMRRGRPACHKAFDEATAVLAGDALLNRAFEIMSLYNRAEPQAALNTMALISRSSGFLGMIGGQVLDLSFEGRLVPENEMRNMIALKTGALLKAACLGGCLLANAPEQQRAAAEKYAEAVGLAFQIQDDILDVVGDTALLGKQTGSDEQQNKTTFVTLYGLEGCRKMVADLTEQALEAAQIFDDNRFIRELALWLAGRDR